ncbi:response regulator [Gloeocapsa sp. PCC 73106]|uniref:response regulator n=1 Tax=Gloeocapsa sp. PCC 73106 TaxID=102232 RepID=UPI0002ACFB2A|nr:response regulator [Gloeocapsa sp. PCC 73106]ELR98113.1 response regulator containing a CheY-like receiver domain and a GGDEF domain [Gloeocapsa sp. PCC 73106]
MKDIHRKPYILAVEDDEDNLLVISYVIEKIQGLFLTAHDCMTALSLAAQHLPDLIILDIVLPEFDGFYFMSQLKQNPLISDIPVIAVTGLISFEAQQRIKEAGCVDYLTKPYLLQTLEERILHHLNCSCFPRSFLF